MSQSKQKSHCRETQYKPPALACSLRLSCSEQDFLLSPTQAAVSPALAGSTGTGHRDFAQGCGSPPSRSVKVESALCPEAVGSPSRLLLKCLLCTGAEKSLRGGQWMAKCEGPLPACRAQVNQTLEASGSSSGMWAQ